MLKSFSKSVSDFSEIAFVFDAESASAKQASLRKISKMRLTIGKELLDYHSLLLFTLTHAEDEFLFNLAQKELKRITSFLKKGNNASHPVLADSGLPFTTMTTRFSPEVFNELQGNKNVEIKLDSLANDGFNLNAFLNISLPPILKDETTAGLDNDSLLELLGVPQNKKFEFLFNEINTIKAAPLAKDYLWQLLNPFFIITGRHPVFSKTYNAIDTASIFFTQQLTKQFDHLALLDQKMEAPAKLSKEQHLKLITVIQNAMTLSMREIDPVTYMDKSSLKFFYLSNGLSIAICGLLPERQLTIQSYISYTLFKNGYPISYGGAWVFGKCALFALNIFEEYRGGESKFVMTQILRVYRQLFDICYFEVEPYQFGNEDALKSGAFWFYYKFGFRPIDKATNNIANVEISKMKQNKLYRSSIKTLTHLANGNIALHLNNERFVHRNEIINPILKLITKRYKGNHAKAISDAKDFFRKHAAAPIKLNADDVIVFDEIALWAFALNITDKEKLGIMTKMIKAKSTDYLYYNQLILSIT